MSQDVFNILLFSAFVIFAPLLSCWIANRIERRQCTCLFEPQASIGMETDEDGTRWNVYPRCGMHGRQQRTRMHEETATASTVAV